MIAPGKIQLSIVRTIATSSSPPIASARAWIRAAQLRTYLLREVGEDWWRSDKTGELLRDLFLEGTRPTSEEVAARLGYESLDTRPLVEDLSAA